MKRHAYLLLFALAALVAGVHPAHPGTLSEIEKGLMCQCGCTMVLASCQCGSADKMRAEIQAKLDKGIPASRIISDYVARYGEKVLSAPPKRGFNLTAWVLPFVAVGAGFAVLFFVIREFARRGRERAREENRSRGGIDPRLRERVDETLRDYL